MKDRLVVFLIILLVTFSCLPLFKNIGNINSHFDWLQMASYYRADRQAILEYKQFPLRTHYFGGGYPLLANPQDGLLNPFFILPLILGEVVGLKINALLAHLIGALGMYYLARAVLKYNYLGALFSTFVFALGGHMHRLLIRGQVYTSCFYGFFMPLTLALFVKTKEDKKYIFLTIIILTVMVTQAGLHFAPLALFLFLFSCLEMYKYKDKRLVFDVYYLKNFFIIMAGVFLLGAVKIFPMLELLKQDSRFVDTYQKILYGLYEAFFTHRKIFSVTESQWTYFYLGYLPVFFAFLSFLIYWRKIGKYFILLVIFFLLSFSAHTRLDLFKWVWQLPVFHSIESPSRYFVTGIIFIVALVSGQIFSISEKMRLRLIRAVFILVIIFVGVDLFLTNSSEGESFPVRIPAYAKQEPFFSAKSLKIKDDMDPRRAKDKEARMFFVRRWEQTRPSQYELMLQNIGKINWYGNIYLGKHAAHKYYVDEDERTENVSWIPNPDYRGEVYFLNNSENSAEFRNFTPNKLIVSVRIFNPGRLVINQNYDKYWVSDYGRTVNHNGLLAIDLERRGDYPISFNYVFWSFYLGLAVSLITLIFMLYYFRRK